MGLMPDYSLLGTAPNFAQSALAGYQAGTNIRKQQQVDQALQGIDLERPETLLPLLRADPATGAALIGSATKLAAEKRDRESRQATADYLKSLPQFGGGGSAPTSSAAAPAADAVVAPSADNPPAATPDGSQPSAVDGDGAIVVEGRPQPSPEQLRAAAISADPQQFMEIQKQLSQLSDAQLKRADDTTQAFANVGQALLQIPYAQRRGFLQAQASYLIQHGVAADKIAAFDPTDDNIHMQVGQALGIKGMIEQQNKDREFALSQDKADEDKRHNRASEANAAGGLAVSQGNLAMRQKEFSQKGSNSSGGSGGSGAIATPSSRSEYESLPKGTRYRAPDGSVRVK